MSDTPPASDSRHARSVVALHAAVLLFGFAGLFGKWLALPPVAIVFGRSAIACAALALLRCLSREREPGGAFEWRLAAGGAVLALHWVAFFQSIQVASVAVGLLGCASFPLFVLLLEWGMRQRGLRSTEWLTAGLVTAGLVTIVPEFNVENRTVQGLAWGVVSGLTFALLTVNNRSLAARHAAVGQVDASDPGQLVLFPGDGPCRECAGDHDRLLDHPAPKLERRDVRGKPHGSEAEGR